MIYEVPHSFANRQNGTECGVCKVQSSFRDATNPCCLVSGLTGAEGCHKGDRMASSSPWDAVAEMEAVSATEIVLDAFRL